MEGPRAAGYGARSANGGLPRDLPLLPAPHLRGLVLLDLHHGPRPLQAGVRRDLGLDRRPDGGPRAGHAVLPHRVQEDPPALLHRGLPGLGTTTRWGVTTPTFTTQRSTELYHWARDLMPGGVNSPVRAMRSIGRDPIFIASGKGARLLDVDGNEYVDWVCSWGPLIAGHAHPAVIDAVASTATDGTTFGAPTKREVTLAAEIAERVESVEMVRMVSSGTEATMSALRLARAVTGRERVLKFAGAYHGHVDGLLADAGSGLATQAIPASPGVPRAATASTVVAPWNRPDLLPATEELAAILVEPGPANMGVVPPDQGFLEVLRREADERGALLIFDEVITGFRVDSV